jgi:ATP-dependent Clp protease ATP-binding subunit ClpA
MFEQFTAEVRAAVTAAHEEARLRGDRRIGTEHLLLGVLNEPAGDAAAAFGADLAAAREALRELDLAALSAVGIDARGVARPPIPASRKHTPFTSGAKSILSGALGEARKAGSRRLTASHVLLALLDCEEPDQSAELVSSLGVDRAAVRARLRSGAGA